MPTNLKESDTLLGRFPDSSLKTNTDKTILQAYNSFVQEYCSARLYSPKTVDTYWWAIKSFIDLMGNMPVSDLDHTVYSQWVAAMFEKGNKKITIHTNSSRLRVFVEYLHLQGWCTLTKEDIKVPKKPKTVVSYAKREDIELLIAAASSIRNKAIIAVMFSTGLRNAEVRSLLKNNIDLDRSELRVEHGKGDKEAILYLDNRAKDLLVRYWASRSDTLPWAFIAGTTCTGGMSKIANSTMRFIFDSTCKRAGLSGISPKSVRHGYGTELMRQNVHMRLIQEAMRHEYITTTQLYTHVEQGELKHEVLKALNSS